MHLQTLVANYSSFPENVAEPEPPETAYSNGIFIHIAIQYITGPNVSQVPCIHEWFSDFQDLPSHTCHTGSNVPTRLNDNFIYLSNFQFFLIVYHSSACAHDTPLRTTRNSSRKFKRSAALLKPTDRWLQPAPIIAIKSVTLSTNHINIFAGSPVRV